MALTLDSSTYDSGDWAYTNAPAWFTLSTSLTMAAVDGVQVTLTRNAAASEYAQFILPFNQAERVHFNLQPWVRDLLTIPNATAASDSAALLSTGVVGDRGNAATSAARIDIEFQEIKDGALLGTALTHTQYHTRSRLDFNQGPLDFDNWLTGTGQNTRFLTDREADSGVVTMYGDDSDQGVVAWVNDSIASNSSTPNTTKLQVKVYNAAGTQLGSTYLSGAIATSHQSVASVVYGSKVCYTPVMPANLLSLGAFTWSSYPNRRCYDAKVVGPSANVHWHFRVNRRTRPCRYDAQQLAWANSKGGIDMVRFELKNRDTVKVKRKQFVKNPFSTAGATIGFSGFEPQEETYQASGERIYDLSHKGHTLEEAQLLESCVRASQAWIRVGTGRWEPVVIETNSLTVETQLTGKLFNTAITVRTSQPLTC